MPRYRLLMNRTTVDTVEIFVEADDKEEAYHKACRGEYEDAVSIGAEVEEDVSDLCERVD